MRCCVNRNPVRAVLAALGDALNVFLIVLVDSFYKSYFSSTGTGLGTYVFAFTTEKAFCLTDLSRDPIP
jgi:hypothetical protein